VEAKDPEALASRLLKKTAGELATHEERRVVLIIFLTETKWKR